MANAKRAYPENVSGDFFVDSTCIDCDTCRQLAPETFAAGHEYSFVHSQPQTTTQVRQALHALLAAARKGSRVGAGHVTAATR